MMDLNQLDWEKVIRAAGDVAEGVVERIDSEYFSISMWAKLSPVLRIDIKCPSVSGPQWEPNSGDEGPYPTDDEILAGGPKRGFTSLEE